MSQTRLSNLERRAAIIDAAIRLFSEKGFAGTTTRELAASVGVSEPVLYQHFGTKRELYAAILEEKAVAGERSLPDIRCPELAPPENDREFLTALATSIVEWHTSDPAYIRLLLFSALEQHEFNEIFFERYTTGFFTGLARFFELRIEQGVYRKLDPMLAAHTFVGMAAHYALTLTVFKKCHPDLPQHNIIDGFVNIFLEGIKKHDA
jgi:AcrR family transcriptional regulator